MLDIIKKREVKSILVSLLLIVLGVFLIIKPEEIITTLIRVIGIISLISGVFYFINYFATKNESKLFDYSLFKGTIEVIVGILFIFKYETLVEIFPMVLGLLIIFNNLFKMQLSLNLKELEGSNYLTGVIISTLSIILGVVVLLNPFASLKVVVIVSGAIILVSELANIFYSLIIISRIRKTSKVVKEIVEK